MYCYHCGKQLSEDAVVCPECGSPTKNNVAFGRRIEEPAPANMKALGAIALTLSIIAFVAGVIFGTFFMTYSHAPYLLFVISAISILPALGSLCVAIWILNTGSQYKSVRAMGITAVVLSAVVLVFLFIVGSMISTSVRFPAIK